MPRKATDSCRNQNLTKLTVAFAKPFFPIGHILVILCCLTGAGSQAQLLQRQGSGTDIPAGEAPIQETGEAGCEPEAGQMVSTDPWEQGRHRVGCRAAAAASTELLVKWRVLPRASSGHRHYRTFPASPPKEQGGAASKANLTLNTILALAPSHSVHPSLYLILRFGSTQYSCQVLINTPSYTLAPLRALRFGKRHLKLCSSMCPARSSVIQISSVKRHQSTPVERIKPAQSPQL